MSWTSGEMVRATGTSTAESIVGTVQRVTTTTVYVSTTTFSTPTGFSAVSLESGKSYLIRAHLYVVSTANGGLKIAITPTTLTATAFRISGVQRNGTVVETAQQATSLGTIYSDMDALTDLEFEGTILVNVAGTIELQAAQSTSYGENTQILSGSWIEFREI